MKTVLKKIIPFILVVCMILGLGACSNSSNQPSGDSKTPVASTPSDKPSSDNSSSDSSSETEEDIDPLGKYEEPIEITVVGTLNDQVQKNTLRDDYTMEDNPWTRAYLENLGIKISYLWIAKSDEEYNTKLNLSLATGEIPDLLRLERTRISPIVESGIIAEMGSYFDKYASDLTREMVEMCGENVWKPVSFNGERYAIPCISGAVDDIKFAWIRKDWLDNLGMEAPTNYEEFYKVIEAFATQDPDGNGKNDTFGLALSKNFIDSVVDTQTFFSLFHSYPNQFVEVDGKLEWGGIQPETKQALEELSKIYANGWIDPEFGVKDSTQVAQDVVTNRVGLTLGRFWTPLNPVLNDLVQSNKDADFVSVPISILGYDGEPVRSVQGHAYSNVVIVSKKCEHPEAVVKMFNLYNILYNEQYETYGSTQDGREIWHLSPVNMAYPGKNVRSHQKIVEVLNNGKTVESQNMIPEEKRMYDNCVAYLNGDRTMWNWYRIFGPEDIGGSSLAAVEKYGLNQKLYQMDGFLGAPGPVMTERKSMLDSMQNEIFVKIIIGEASIDDFDKFVEDWKNAGGNELTQEVNKWYSANN